MFWARQTLVENRILLIMNKLTKLVTWDGYAIKGLLIETGNTAVYSFEMNHTSNDADVYKMWLSLVKTAFHLPSPFLYCVTEMVSKPVNTRNQDLRDGKLGSLDMGISVVWMSAIWFTSFQRMQLSSQQQTSVSCRFFKKQQQPIVAGKPVPVSIWKDTAYQVSVSSPTAVWEFEQP